MKLALGIAGWANIVIGALHVLILVRAREMFYWVGIGPEMDRLAAVHFLLPYLLSVATGAVFCVFGLYALAAAGDIGWLPFLRPAIILISWVYLVRAVGGTGMGGFIEDATFKDAAFSTVALTIGVLYAIGARALAAGAERS